ncbi:MAG: hypothetical protein IJ097_02930 [Bacilli bacterium]|nr:hypothetical protein [Bacilli bacterium]
MKKILIIVILSLFLLTGCFNLNIRKDVVKTSYGTYRIDNLVARADHSTKDKVFYTLEKDKNAKLPDNISVNMGTNRYRKEDHVLFRKAIQQQLLMQIGKDASLNGIGLTTTKNNIVYKFVITKKDDKTEITQFYIIGDYKYVLVHETNFSKNPSLNTAAYNIVDTFEWK